MIYTKESGWFNHRSVFSFFLFSFLIFQGTVIRAQSSWSMQSTVDYYLTFQNFWYEGDGEVEIEAISGEYGNFIYEVPNPFKKVGAHFPFEFESELIDSITSGQGHDITINLIIDGNVVYRTAFFYDPSPNTLLQMNRFEKEIDLTEMKIWGDVIDAYEWVDKAGQNVVVRSLLDRDYISEDSVKIEKKYINFYHFLNQNDEFKLLRKFTESSIECDIMDSIQNSAIQFELSEIELTDINKDTIGEINLFYAKDCPSASDTRTDKLLMTTLGEKYMIQLTFDDRKSLEKNMNRISKSTAFQLHPYYERYLMRKFQSKISEVYESNP